MLNIGARIFDYREKRGLTQSELAQKIGMAQANLSNIEKGKRDLTISTLIRIASALGIKPADFFQENNSLRAISITRTMIENLAEEVVSPSNHSKTDLRALADDFRVLKPEASARGSQKKMEQAWRRVRNQFTPEEIRGIFSRIQDAEQRRSYAKKTN